MSLEEIEAAIVGDISGDTPLMPYIVSGQQEDKVAGEDEIYFDIRFVVMRKEKNLKILFDLEPQKSYYPGYTIVTRGILYCSRMISAQVDTEFEIPKYDGLKKVYSIWLCFNAPQKVGNAITKYHITKENVLGDFAVEESAYDKMEIVQICLQEDAYEHEDEMIKLLNTVFSTKKSFKEIEKIVENEYNIPMNNKWGEEVQQMCNLSQGIEEKGILKGLELGIEQQKQDTASFIKKMQEKGWSAEKILASLSNLESNHK